jgi:outer membrane lipoprotein-sorting protein
MKKFRQLLLLASISGPLFISACGGSEVTTPPVGYKPATVTTTSNCCCTCQNTTKKPVKTTSSPKPATNASATPGKDNPTTPVATPKPTTTDTNASDAKVKGRKILDALMAKIHKSNAFEVVVDKSEKVLSTGQIVTSGIHLWAKNPNLVKLEMTAHSTKASSVGTKLTYTSNTGKVKVRPAGILSIVTTELAMDDDRIVSPNGYTPDETDIFGLVSRLSQPVYEAELEGKTTLNGSEIYLLKVTRSSGKNELDERIIYEHIGFDANTYIVKLWETFNENGKDPYMRYNLKTFNLLDSISDKTMSL